MSETEKPISEWTLEELDSKPRKGQGLTPDEICMWDCILGKQKLTLEEQEMVDKMKEKCGDI